jgi:hypothetical protein
VTAAVLVVPVGANAQSYDWIGTEDGDNDIEVVTSYKNPKNGTIGSHKLEVIFGTYAQDFRDTEAASGSSVLSLPVL